MKPIVASFLVIIPILVSPIISTTTYAAETTDDELTSAFRSMAYAFGYATAQAQNCNSAIAIKRISSLKGAVYACFTVADFNSEPAEDLLNEAITNERQLMSRTCDREALTLYLRRLEGDYKNF